jgi:hypothetical protein
MTTAPNALATARRKNPYRGPREFSREDQLPNRQREARELTDLVVAERVVLLHSPSGAGKTSLVEAAVVDGLRAEGFCATPRLRVNEPVDEGAVPNPYIHSLVSYLLGACPAEERPSDLSLSEAVTRWRDVEQPGKGRTVLIIDQLEEVLTLNPADWDVKEAFFQELGKLLAYEPVWALLSMREDYMGGLDRYLRFLPGHLRSRYRLDFLTRADAILAMRVPAERQRVEFKQEAAERLADLLAVTTIQRPGEQPEEVGTPYVQPFQLQVVCRQLWRSIRKHRGDDFTTIELSDVEQYADVNKALKLYFGDTIANVVNETQADEQTVRDWFEYELITNQNFRSQTLSPPKVSNPESVIRQLEEGYLIRGDLRGASTWYELTHDRLIRPVQESNDAWRRAKLEPWRSAAYIWNDNDRQGVFLLPAEEIPKQYLRKELPESGFSQIERAFLESSVSQARQKGVWIRTRNAMSVLGWTVLIETMVIVVLVIALFAK